MSMRAPRRGGAAGKPLMTGNRWLRHTVHLPSHDLRLCAHAPPSVLPAAHASMESRIWPRLAVPMASKAFTCQR